MYLFNGSLGQTDPSQPDASSTPTQCPPCSDSLPSSVAHPYQTGAGYIFGILMSGGWVVGIMMGVNYLRKLKKVAR